MMLPNFSNHHSLTAIGCRSLSKDALVHILQFDIQPLDVLQVNFLLPYQ